MTTRSESDLDFYDRNLDLYKRLLAEVRFILEDAITFKIHSLPGRVKERDSVAKKILDRQYADPEHDMTDLVGLRVICLFESDLKKVDAVIQKAFNVVRTENKISEADDNTFGYMSVHYICKLLPENQGPRYRNLHDIEFEIQSRTILMDAWANVSHYLAYKGKNSIPDDKKRAFYALAGLFYVADSQFEQLQKGVVHAPAESLGIQTLTSEDDLTLDRDRVEALLEDVFPDRSIIDKEDPVQRLAAISQFVEEVTALNYKTVADLRTALEKGKPGALKYEVDHPPHATPGRTFAPVGIARAALGIADRRYGEIRGFEGNYRKYRNLPAGEEPGSD